MSRRDLAVLNVPAPAVYYDPSAIPQVYSSPGFTLLQIASIVWAYRKQTLLIMLAALALAALVTKLMPKTYEAKAALMVDYEINDPLGKEFPTGLISSYMATQIDLLRSPAVMLPAIERLKLADNPKYREGFSGDPQNLPEFIRSSIAKHLTIEQGQWGSQLIYISYTADDAQEAARVANAIADVYADQQLDRVNGPSGERSRRYTQQLEELKRNVNAAQDRLTAFRQRTGLIDAADNKTDIGLDRLTDLEHRLLEAQEMRRTAEVRASGNISVAEAELASNSVQQLKTDLAGQQSRMAELSATMGPRHPDVIQLRAQIAATRRAIGAEMSSYSGNAQAQVGAARQREQQLLEEVKQERVKVLEHRKVQDEGSKYALDLESAQTLYRRALDGFDQVALSSGGGYTNVRFVNRATPPVKADKPKPLVNLALGLMAGGFFGIVGPLVYELFNRRVRCRDDLDRDFGLPVLVEFDRMPVATGAT